MFYASWSACTLNTQKRWSRLSYSFGVGNPYRMALRGLPQDSWATGSAFEKGSVSWSQSLEAPAFLGVGWFQSTGTQHISSHWIYCQSVSLSFFQHAWVLICQIKMKFGTSPLPVASFSPREFSPLMSFHKDEAISTTFFRSNCSEKKSLCKAFWFTLLSFQVTDVTWASDQIRWPPEISSNLNHVFVWFCDLFCCYENSKSLWQ